MCGVSSGARANRVFTVHKKASSTLPMATAFTKVFDARRPARPFTRKPASGSVGISQRCCIGSVLQVAHFIDFQRRAILEHRQDDRQADRGLSRRHHHHKEGVDMAIRLPQLIGEGDKAQVDRVQHQLDRHEHGDDVAAEYEAGHAQPKQNGAEDQIPRQRNGGGHSISFRASTTAPRMAISTSTEVASNGNRYWVNSRRPTSRGVPPVNWPKLTPGPAGTARWTI